jgi:hypothetical protein
LKITYDTNGVGTDVFTDIVTADDAYNDNYLVFFEGGDSTGVFSNTDDNSEANLEVNSAALRGTTATIDYNDSPVSFVVSNDFGTLDMDESTIGDEWNSGESLAVTLVDQDLNKNTQNDEDMTLTTHQTLIPSMQIGSPITLEDSSTFEQATMTCGTFNKICTIASVPAGDLYDNHAATVQLTLPDTVAEFRDLADGASFVYLNYDLSEVATSLGTIILTDGDTLLTVASSNSDQNSGFVELGAISAVGTTDITETANLAINFTEVILR